MSVAFLHTNNEQSKKEINLKNVICTRIKQNKILRNKLNQEVKDLYAEIYKTFWKEIKENTY